MKKYITIILLGLLVVGALQAQRRYAGRVLGLSTEYHHYPDQWAGYQMLGMPDVYPSYGDYGAAWSPADYGVQRDWIELEFDNAGPVDSILIWETNYPGFIDTVYVQNPGNLAWVAVYIHTAQLALQEARILRIGFPMTNFNVSRVRIAMATNVAQSYPEIDAVALHPASGPNHVLSNVIGTALSLDGVDDEFHTYTPIRNAFAHDFSLMAWVKPIGPANSVGAYQYGGGIVGDSYHSIFQVAVANTGGGDSLYFMTLGSVSGVVSTAYTAGDWMHIAMVQKAGIGLLADSLIGYVNGVKVGAFNSAGPNMDYYSFHLGRNDDGGAHFAGQIDEFKTFDRALDVTEIRNQLNLIGYPAITNGLTGYWQFNEGSGTGHFNGYNHITDSLLFGASYVPAGYTVAVDPATAPQFEIYPNPSAGQLRVRGDFHGVTGMQVLDLTGKVVWNRVPSQGATTQDLDLSHLSAGMYMLRVEGKKFSLTEKIVLK